VPDNWMAAHESERKVRAPQEYGAG